MDYFENQYTDKLGSNDEAIKRLALHFDLYLDDSILNASRKVNVGNSRIAQYISKANLQQYKDKTYDSYIEENQNAILYSGNLLKSESYTEQPERQTNWTDGDIKNKNYVIQTIGYDCFDDPSYQEENKKFLYNTISDYLSDDVIEDQHKLQSIIAMVKSILQREQIDTLLNAQIRQTTLNYPLIQQLGDIKKILTTDINTTAKENAISAKNNGKSSKGSNTLTNITKEMIDNNFDEVKINIVDIKMSNAYQVIAEKSSQALMAELNYSQDDYARLLSESRVFNENLQDALMKAEEENRLLKIENKLYKDGDT